MAATLQQDAPAEQRHNPTILTILKGNDMTIEHSRDFVARSKNGLRWEKLHAATLEFLRNTPDKHKSEIEAANQRLRAQYEMWQGKIGINDLVSLNLTPGSVQTTSVLQNMSVAYTNDEYIGLRLMPSFPVSFGTDAATWWELDKETMFEAPDDTIGTGGSVNNINAGFVKQTATMHPHALQGSVDARSRAAMDAPVLALASRLPLVVNGLRLNQEKRIVAIAGSSASFGSNTAAISAADQWNTDLGGDPAGSVDAAKAELFSGIAETDTVAFCNERVFNVLKRHPTIREQFKYTGRETLSRQMLAEYFEVDDLLVGKAREQTANEGATQSWTNLWPSVFGVVKVPRVVQEKIACFGITLEEPMMELEHFEPNVGGWGEYITKVAFSDSSKVISSSCGYLLTGVIG